MEDDLETTIREFLNSKKFRMQIQSVIEDCKKDYDERQFDFARDEDGFVRAYERGTDEWEEAMMVESSFWYDQLMGPPFYETFADLFVTEVEHLLQDYLDYIAGVEEDNADIQEEIDNYDVLSIAYNVLEKELLSLCPA